ncbi:MAG: transcriptional regulator, GntR family [Actinotalea sp.]|nr:transcriptional regulator, GntR family [Actinotalea sp.]
MAHAASSKPEAAGPEELAAIAESVRGSFQTVEDMAQSYIREAIHQGAFPPGHRLNLDSIAATLGISRMPVRASLRQLESEGLLRINAYRGATVSVLRSEEIAEIYELRTLLETYLLERAGERMTDSVLDQLAAIVDELETSQELGPRLERRRSFYQLLYQQAQRPRALEQVNQLRGSVGHYLLLQRVDEHRGHETLLNFLRAGDVAGATAWLQRHLAHVSATLQEMVGDGTGPARDS